MSISQEITYTAQMFIQVHENSSDQFYKDVVKISKALLQCYHDQQAENKASDIAEQLKETNRLLAILAHAATPIAGHRVTPAKPVILKSVALDGTVREAEAP